MRQSFGFKEALACFLLASILVTAHADWLELARGSLADVDSYMRIVWLEDMLDHREALHKVLRDGSGDGTIIHWTHLVTALIYAIALPLSAFMPMKTAIHASAVIFGPLGVGLLGVLAAWCFSPMTEPRWRWLAAVAVGVAAPILNYGSPGLADHHILLACVALGLAGLAGRVVAGGSSSAAPLGALAGVGVWLSPEALPFIAMSLGACVLPWIFGEDMARRRAGRALTVAGGAFVAVVFGALLIDPPVGGYAATDNDRLSVVYLALSLCLFLSFCFLHFVPERRAGPLSRAVVAFVAALSPLIGWMYLFPGLIRGFLPFSDNDEIRSFFDGSEEFAPLTSAGEALGFLADAILAAIGLAWFAFRGRSVYWLYAAACLAATILMGVLHRRFLIYTSVASAAMLPALLDECTRLLSRHSRLAQTIGRLTLVFLTLMPNRLYAALGSGNEAPAPAGSGDRPAPTCNVREFAGLLRPYAGEVVMGNVNDTPALLYHTKVLTVGSMYHRGFEATKRLSNAWMSRESGSVPAEVRATKARYLLICRSGGRYPRIPDDALFARLQRGEVPVWAREEVSDPKTGFVLYRIVDEPARARPD
jgi:hypothetical protein